MALLLESDPATALEMSRTWDGCVGQATEQTLCKHGSGHPLTTLRGGLQQGATQTQRFGATIFPDSKNPRPPARAIEGAVGLPPCSNRSMVAQTSFKHLGYRQWPSTPT